MLRYLVCATIATTAGLFAGQATGIYVSNALAIRIVVALAVYSSTFVVLLRIWCDHDSP
jgi:hypothetical protein